MSSKVRKSAEHDSHHEEAAGAQVEMPDAQFDARTSKAEMERRWLAEHDDAIRAENEYLEKHGLPLARYRLF